MSEAHPHACFNPLHCGAVVASGWRLVICDEQRLFQSPSLRGSGRFGRIRNPFEREANVSIPFIAGQWSLRAWAEWHFSRSDLFQSPSLRGSGRFRAQERARAEVEARRFNPLHCGAVVAS